MDVVQLYYLIYILALINWSVGSASLKSFLSQTTAIAGNLDFQNFAAMVRRHMIQALLQIVLLATGMLLGIFILVSGKAGLLLIIAVNGVILGAGLLGKPLEKRAQSLKVLDPLLEERYRTICNTWQKKPFPDF